MSWGLTSVLTGSQEVDDIGVMPQFAQNFQFSRKVTMVIFRGILCVKNPVSFLSEIILEKGYGLVRTGVSYWREPGGAGDLCDKGEGQGSVPGDLSAS